MRSGLKKKLSYNEQREFEQLPARIGELEAEQESLNQSVAHPEFYKEPAAEDQAQALARLDQVHDELLRALQSLGRSRFTLEMKHSRRSKAQGGGRSRTCPMD